MWVNEQCRACATDENHFLSLLLQNVISLLIHLELLKSSEFVICCSIICRILLQVILGRTTFLKNMFFHIGSHMFSAGLWGLMNNAGLNFVGDAELTTMEQYANQVNINQLGVVRVTKAFLPEIRRRKGLNYRIYLVTCSTVLPFSACLCYYMQLAFHTCICAFISAIRGSKWHINTKICVSIFHSRGYCCPVGLFA